MRSYHIVAGINKQDPRAISEVWTTYYPLVSEIIYRLTRDSPDAKDLVTETMLKILYSSQPFDSLEGIRGSLVTSAKNASLNYIKRNLNLDSKSPDIAYHYQHVFQESEADAETAGVLSKRICEAIEGLKPKCKEVFKLYYNHKLKNREIAERLGISEKAVEKQKTKAFNILKFKIKGTDRFMYSIIFL
jgi:RNA polymerase sigma factor (sigma-70 family)